MLLAHPEFTLLDAKSNAGETALDIAENAAHKGLPGAEAAAEVIRAKMPGQAPEVNPSRERASQSNLHGAGQVPADDPRLMPPIVPDTVPPPLGPPPHERSPKLFWSDRLLQILGLQTSLFP